MKIELDIPRLKDAVRKSKNALKDLEKANDKLTKNFIADATDNLNYIARTAIDKFYEDYEPHFYERTFDLYNTYRIKVTEDDWEIEFDPSFMKEEHRVDYEDPEYIFENSFIRGWHGGAINGPLHPNPGTPYWRIPMEVMVTVDYGILRYYGRVQDESEWILAIRSPSPYDEIMRKSRVYMKLEINAYHKQYNNNIEKFQRRMKWNLERIR